MAYQLQYGDSGNATSRDMYPTYARGLIRFVESDRAKVVSVRGTDAEMITLAMRILAQQPALEIAENPQVRLFAKMILAGDPNGIQCATNGLDQSGATTEGAR